MRQLLALAWKEWRESRWLLAVGIGVFLGLPMIGAWQAKLAGQQRFMPFASIGVLLLGPVMAMLLAVAAVGRDVVGQHVLKRVEDFWRSRPVGVGPWLGVKFAVGLAETLLVLGLPLAYELREGRAGGFADSFAGQLAGWAPFQWVALYGIGFATACLVRRPAHAAAVGGAAVLLVCFAPVVLPPLERLSIPWLMRQADRAADPPAADSYDALTAPAMPGGSYVVPFAAFGVGLAVASLALAVVAVGREWEFRTGRRLLYGTAGGVVLLLVWTTATQYGNNLPVLATAALGPDERVLALRSDGRNGAMLTIVGEPWADNVGFALRRLTVDGDQLVVGPPLKLRPEWNVTEGLTSRTREGNYWLYGGREFAWRPDRPDVVQLWGTVHTADGPWAVDIVTLTLDRDASDPVLRREKVRFERLPIARTVGPVGDPIVFKPGDVVFPAAAFDAAAAEGQPGTPDDEPARAAPLVKFTAPWTQRWTWGVDRQTFSYPMLPGRSERDLLGEYLPDLHGGVVYKHDYSSEVRSLSAWQLEGFEPPRLTFRPTWAELEISVFRFPLPYLAYGARFRRLGNYFPSYLDRMLNRDAGIAASTARYVYATSDGSGGQRRSRLKVVDFANPAAPKSAGHFAVPERGPLVVVPLPDGRTLAGGEGHLYLLGPPR